jgi:hypothetical protein
MGRGKRRWDSGEIGDLLDDSVVADMCRFNETKEKTMNKTKFSLMILLTLILVLASAVPAQANKKTDFVVTFWDLDMNNPAGSPYEALYTIDYAGEEDWGSGLAFFTRFYTSGESTVKGELVDDEDGSSMVIQIVYHDLLPFGDCDPFGTGSFVIRPTLGSGRYVLMGNGAIYACNVDNIVYGTLEGWATEFSQGN